MELALKDFLAEVKKNVSGDVRTDDYSRILYSTDASIYQVKPHGVLIPRDGNDLQAAIESANKFGIAITPRTGGSSLAGQAVNESLIMDLSRYMDNILEVNTEERWVWVQPGVVLDELNIHLKPHGLQFGPDPASSNRAALGGIVSNNSTGSHSIMYGMTADHVLELKGYLSDGTPFHYGPEDEDDLNRLAKGSGLNADVYRKMIAMRDDPRVRSITEGGTPKHWRRCGGYNLERLLGEGFSYNFEHDTRFNLAKLICGAEGTLGVISEIKLNLVPLPKITALAVVHFDDLKTALKAVPIILEKSPSAVELLDNLGLTLCRDVPDYARLMDVFIDGHPNCVLLTEFYGEGEKELKAKIESLEEHIRSNKVGHSSTVSLFNKEAQAKAWKVRKVGLGLLMSIKGDHKPIPFIEDAAVPVEHLADYVTKIESYCNKRGTKVAYYAHASAGCVHIRPLVNTKEAKEISKLPEIVDFSVDLLRGYGGSLSSEHGDGKARSWANEKFFGPELYGLYQDIKGCFDPKNILNPGNVVNAPDMREDLRYGENYKTLEIDSVLDFSTDLGFHRAVEMCNGAGICRKKTTGTMCPSFMVTREEEHSVRGRANALRAALSGNLPHDELTSQRMYEVMDLCIECKACKAECPSSVDMAKIKFEFLNQYHKKNGIPLRSRIFSSISSLNKIGSGPLSGLANLSLTNKASKSLLGKITKTSRRRSLPSFARQPFEKWFAKHPSSTGSLGKVVLFTDTFNNYNTPKVAIAAVQVLEHVGYEVVLSNHGCCGRPSISKGLAEKATKQARTTVDRLFPFASQGLAIVGLEPSCLLSLKDEYQYLLGDEKAKLVGEQSILIEEFLQEGIDEGLFDLDLKKENREIVLHGHCHQKALVGTDATKAVLSCSGAEVHEVDSGCCGMAGSFGYEEEHYELSIAMANRRLAPHIQQSPHDAIIAAPGFSCRSQIKHTTGRVAQHPVEIIAENLSAKKN